MTVAPPVPSYMVSVNAASFPVVLEATVSDSSVALLHNETDLSLKDQVTLILSSNDGERACMYLHLLLPSVMCCPGAYRFVLRADEAAVYVTAVDNDFTNVLTSVVITHRWLDSNVEYQDFGNSLASEVTVYVIDNDTSPPSPETALTPPTMSEPFHLELTPDQLQVVKGGDTARSRVSPCLAGQLIAVVVKINEWPTV
eukprot:scaffold161490_cov33-Prasinocladus_malaysianus.AAC.7